MAGEQGTDRSALQKAVNDMKIISVCDDHICTGSGGNPGGRKLGGHSACADTAAAPFSHFHVVFVNFFDKIDKMCLWIFMRIIGIQSVDIREQDQQIRMRERCYDRGERIVVTELNLLGGNGIVFIDDRYRADFHKLIERVGGIHAA